MNQAIRKKHNNANGIHTGESTHNHDQSIRFVNLSTTNAVNNKLDANEPPELNCFFIIICF